MRYHCALTAVLMILVVGILESQALAEYEDIEPAVVGSPDQWQLSSGLNKVLAVTDADDGTYILEDSVSHVQDFALTDPSGINGDDTIDSVSVVWRAQDSGGGTNEGRVNLYLSGSTSNGASVSLTTTWADYDQSFHDKPGGSGWTIDDVNGLEVQTECTSIAKSRDIRCSEIYVRVYYTPAAGNVSPRRRKIKTDFGG